MALVALVFGLAGGFAGSMLTPPRDGTDGARGPAGARGVAGKGGLPGKAGPAGSAAKVESLGFCYSTQDGTSNTVYYLTGVYISSPLKHPDGTTYCADGTYDPVEPQAEGSAPEGD